MMFDSMTMLVPLNDDARAIEVGDGQAADRHGVRRDLEAIGSDDVKAIDRDQWGRDVTRFGRAIDR